MSEVRERDTIDDDYKWSLESIYEDDEAWEEDFEAVEELIERMEAYEGRLDESGAVLLEALEAKEDLERTVSTVTSYARMRWDEDTRRERYQALTSRAKTLAAEADAATSFIEPELQSLDPETIEDWIASVDGLGIYEHYIDDVIRLREHTRSAEVEELLADLSDVLGAPSDVYQIFHNADLTFPSVEDADGEEIEITVSNFTSLLQRPDRDVRRRVYESYFDTWGDYRNTVATAYSHVVKRERQLADARNYDSALEKSLSGPNIPVEVYDRLVDTIDDNLDALHRHVDLKRTMLDVDELQMWDLYAPIAEGENPELPYEDAVEHVTGAFDYLGDDYRTRVAEGIESQWVDVYENPGKRGGAYSGGTYDTQPFILMNYQDDINSMYTLAHELGHSLHSEFTSEAQPYIYGSYSIFIAEIASTVNEVLLTNHLLETEADPVFKQHVLDQSLERFRSVLYRQTMFAKFEREAHELAAAGEAITADRLDDIYGTIKSDFYEPAAIDDHIVREWMRIPHFYRPFYVFQYATGISAAVAIAADIIENGQPAADRYIDFLSLGSSEYPMDLLETAGVDMTTAAPIESAIDVYHDRLDQYEQVAEIDLA